MRVQRFLFAYPSEPHHRRHGPGGYKHYGQYRDWLRDDFEFRCVFCLCRETWSMMEASWDIDHCIPRAIDARLALVYGNLLYTCHRCNNTKRAHVFPNPCEVAYAEHLIVGEDGSIAGKTDEGRRIIRLMKLDSPSANRARRLYIMIEHTFAGDPLKYRLWMGYPHELPDIESLAKEVPSNARPEGVKESCLARKNRGDLPDVY
jgi:hypothetical protein